MMKCFVLASLLLAASSVAAQWQWSCDLGGSLTSYRYYEQGLEAMDGELPDGGQCHMTARVGYSFNSKVIVGLLIGAGYEGYRFVDGYYNPLGEEWRRTAESDRQGLSMMAGLYLRVELIRRGPWGLYAELSGNYLWGKKSELRTEQRASDPFSVDMKRRLLQRQIGVRLLPVLSYSFNDHWSAEFWLDAVALTFDCTNTVRYPWAKAGSDADSKVESENVTTDFGFGANLLQNNGVSLGFCYTF